MYLATAIRCHSDGSGIRLRRLARKLASQQIAPPIFWSTRYNTCSRISFHLLKVSQSAQLVAGSSSSVGGAANKRLSQSANFQEKATPAKLKFWQVGKLTVLVSAHQKHALQP
jgi:hypothetical protein